MQQIEALFIPQRQQLLLLQPIDIVEEFAVSVHLEIYVSREIVYSIFLCLSLNGAAFSCIDTCAAGDPIAATNAAVAAAAAAVSKS